MFLSREIDIKLCQNYTKSYIQSVQSGMTSQYLPPIALRYGCHVIHVTSILHCYWRKFWQLYFRFGIILTQFYINFSRQEHQMSYMYRSKPEILRFQPIPLSVFLYSPFKVYSLWVDPVHILCNDDDNSKIMCRSVNRCVEMSPLIIIHQCVTSLQ